MKEVQQLKTRDLIHSIAVMVGYIIGVGMFGLPYLTARAGLVSFFVWLGLLGAMQYFFHLLYGNIITETKEFHRMPGYAGIYLGAKGKYISFAAKMLGSFGALLAYIILAGQFAYELLAPIFGGSVFLYASVIFFFEALVVFWGVKFICRTEIFMTLLLLLVVLLIALSGWDKIELANYQWLDWRLFFLPYGAMLFAVDGSGSIPIIAQVLKRNVPAMKKAIQIGTLIPVIVIAAFVLTVVGVSGAATSQDALAGLGGFLGPGVIKLALSFGVLSIITSFFVVAESVKETLWWDFKLNKYLAWALAVFLPYILFIFGMNNFISVVSFVGAIAGSISAIILIFVFFRLEKRQQQLAFFQRRPPTALLLAFALLFLVGMVLTIFSF